MAKLALAFLQLPGRLFLFCLLLRVMLMMLLHCLNIHRLFIY